MRILYGKIEDAGIQVNCRMGLSPEEHEEIRRTEHLEILMTDSGLLGLYYSDGMPALNGTSAEGILQRGDVRAEKLRKLLNPHKMGNRTNSI